jgi:hypothetical protein
MNTPITAYAPHPDDFVFRTADRMRIDGCTNAIAREGLSLSLQCEHEALLDHYTQLLLKRLRQEAPEHHIEVYFPTNTDALLARFNDALARQSVQQATRTSTGVSPAQIWVVHDAQALPDAEIQLLARLIQNFPGANIRAILLMKGTADGHNNLSAFGRKILRWEIEAPNAEQAQATLDMARAEGRQQPVQQLLRRIKRQSWTDDGPGPETEDAAQFAQDEPPHLEKKNAAQQIKQQVQAFHANGRKAIDKSTQLLGKWDKSHTRLALWVAAALTLSTLTMLWLQPEAFGIGKTKATQPTPAAIGLPEPGTGNTPAQALTPATVGPAAAAAPVAPVAPNKLP